MPSLAASPQQVIEHECGRTAMDVAGRPLVRGAQMEIAHGFTVGVAADLHRRRNRIAQPDDGVSHAIRSPLARSRTPKLPSVCFRRKTRGRRVDLGLGRRDRIRVHLGSDPSVDQLRTDSAKGP